MLGALALGVALTSGQIPADVRELTRQAEQRISELQREADRLAAQTRTVLGELRALEVEREIKVQETRKADTQLATVTHALEQTTARLRSLEAQRLAETPAVRERLVEIYKRGRASYAKLLLAGDDMRALGRMSRGVAAVAELDRVRLEAHRRTIREERTLITELEARRKAVATAQAEATKARTALDRAVVAHNQRLDELDRRRDLAARYVGELQAAQTELQKRVTTLPSDRVAALPLAPFRGTLEWPVQGPVTSRFGRNQAGRFGTAIVRNGIEIAATAGQDVRAVHGGTVAYAAPFTGFATLVIVDHANEAFTLYGHLSQAVVTPGTRVSRGTVVGRAGRSPSGAEGVYFELRIDGRPVDPVQWLRSSR